jgi:PTS system fructose-specific IIC component
MSKIVAVTGCPTGIAHTMMAGEALKKTAEQMGHQLRAETQGAEGVRDALTVEEIEAADVVIVISDIHIDMSRFAGKPMYAASVVEAIRYSKAVIEAALDDKRKLFLDSILASIIIEGEKSQTWNTI